VRAQGRNNHRAADAPIGSEGESWSGSTRNLPPSRSFLRGSNGYQLPRPLAKSILRKLYTPALDWLGGVWFLSCFALCNCGRLPGLMAILYSSPPSLTQGGGHRSSTGLRRCGPRAG